MTEAVVGADAQTELPLSPSPAPKRFELPKEEAESVPKDVQNTGEQAPPPVSDGDTPKEEKEVTPDEAESKRAQRRIDRKIDKAYRQRAEAQARAELLEKQLNELKSQTPQAQKVEGEPTLAQFDFDPEKYAAAKAEFAKSQALKEAEQARRAETSKAEQQRLLTAWQEKVDRAEEKYDDFDQVVGEIQPNNPLIAAIMEAENGEDIAYHLGKNPKEARRIAALPPLSQVREIGKLEVKLLSEVEKPKAPSKAPAPINPLKGTSPVVTDVPSEQDDTAQWIKKRQKQVHGRR